MPQKNNQLMHFLTVGIIKVLWRFSRTGLFGFVLPTWLFVFMQIGIVVGLAIHNAAFATGLYCFGGFCFLLMLGSLWLGFRTAQGSCRIIAIIQMLSATAFALVTTYRNISHPGGPPLEPKSVESVLSAFLMFVLFVIVVLIDASRMFSEQRAME